VLDLLPPSHTRLTTTKLASRQGKQKLEVVCVSGGGSDDDDQPRVVVRGLTSSPVHNVDEAKALFEAGMKARAVASTDVHEHSSRSHCIVRVDVRGVLRGKQTSVKDTSEGKKEKSHRKEEEGETTLGRLYLVDLAGSERVNKSGVSE
jgi:hypothetical protein